MIKGEIRSSEVLSPGERRARSPEAPAGMPGLVYGIHAREQRDISVTAPLGQAQAATATPPPWTAER
jgi:hypothetical protein